MKSFIVKKKLLIIYGILVSGVVFIVLYTYVIIPSQYYDLGIKNFDEGNFSEAIESFSAANGYLDSDERIVLSTKALNYTDGVEAINNEDYSSAVDHLIKAADYNDAQQKLQEVANILFARQEWDIVITAYDSLDDPEHNENRIYALGMQALSKKEYQDALDNFLEIKNMKGVANKIIEAHYNLGIQYFNEADYYDALDNFDDAKGYKDTTSWINKTHFMIAEERLSKAKYDEAKIFYKTLPSGYKFNGVSVASRLKAIDLYEYFAKLEGDYKCTYGYMEARQISKRSGHYDYWYKNDNGGALEIEVGINSNGAVVIEGEVEADVYTKFSVVSNGLKSETITAKFSHEISSKSTPQTLHNADNITIKYNGGSSFTFSYHNLVKNHDIYFNYRYLTDYKFSK